MHLLGAAPVWAGSTAATRSRSSRRLAGKLAAQAVQLGVPVAFADGSGREVVNCVGHVEHGWIGVQIGDASVELSSSSPRSASDRASWRDGQSSVVVVTQVVLAEQPPRGPQRADLLPQREQPHRGLVHPGVALGCRVSAVGVAVAVVGLIERLSEPCRAPPAAARPQHRTT